MPYDDSWRDHYDAWKLRSPDEQYGYYDDEPELDCEHEHYDIDVCTGRAECDSCFKSWYLSPEEIDQYQEDCEREEHRHRRREFWRKLTYPIRWPLFRALERIWPRKAHRVLLDEEIPF